MGPTGGYATGEAYQYTASAREQTLGLGKGLKGLSQGVGAVVEERNRCLDPEIAPGTVAPYHKVKRIYILRLIIL